MFDVVARWDDSEVWIVRVPSIPGCLTYGRSLAQSRERAREALTLWTCEENPEFHVRPELPDWVEEDVESLERAREEYRRASANVAACLSLAARSIVDAGVSLRDAAVILEMSHQRISQIIRGSK